MPQTTASRPNIHEESKGPNIRARSTVIRTENGRVISVVNIGVDRDHPMADLTQAGVSGLHNINIGGISMPAPQFVIVHNHVGDRQSHGDQVAGNIEALVNDLMRGFMQTFSSSEFLRMQSTYSNFNPRDFMSNFNQNFESDEFFEMVRRISEREAEAR